MLTPPTTPIITLEEADAYIEVSFEEEIETLLLSNDLNDEMGVDVNMAIVRSGILERGYLSDGVEQQDGYRIHSYKECL